MANSNVKSGDSIRNQAAWISAIASLVIFAMKVFAYKITGSTAVLSDALESIVNVIASVVALFVIRIAAQPADLEHPYGHGKAESFSSTLEGGMILFASFMIIGEAAKALIYHEPTRQLELGLLIVGIAAVLNLFLGMYLRRIGTIHKSEALRASGSHVISDVVTTVGVMVGIALVLVTEIAWLDPVIAIAVGLQLAFSGYKIVRESLGVLMDEQDEESLTELAKALNKNRTPGIIDIHELRTIRSGRFHHVDAHLVVPEYWDIAHVHGVIEEFEAHVVNDYDFDGELAFHLDPCKKSYCAVCDVEQCPIRQEPFREAPDFTVKSLTGAPQPTKQGAYGIDNDSVPAKKN